MCVCLYQKCVPSLDAESHTCNKIKRKAEAVERPSCIPPAETSNSSTPHGRSRLFIPLHPGAQPVHRLSYSVTGQRTHGQYAGITNAVTLVALHDLLHQSLLDADSLDAVLPVLLVGEDEQRYPLRLGVLQHILENEAALVEAAGAVVVEATIANVGGVDDEDDGVAAVVVALPQLAQGVLAAHVPDLEVHVGQGQGRDILADGGHGLELGRGRVGQVHGLDLFVKGGLAGIVEAEEDDGVFCGNGRC